MAAKRALFSKPSWAAKESAPDKDDKPIFQQNIYEDILEARKLKEEKRAARQKEKEREKSNAEEYQTSSIKSNVEESKSVKRRRISDEYNDRDKAGSGSASSSESDNDSNSSKTLRSSKRPSTDEKLREQKGSNSPQDHRPERKSTRAAKAPLTILDDEDEDNSGRTSNGLSQQNQIQQDEVVLITHAVPTKSKQKPKPRLPESDSEEDEELKALKKRAREEARLKKLNTVQASNNRETPVSQDSLKSPSVPSQSSTESTSAVHPVVGDEQSKPLPTPLVADLDDPEVQILVRTIIPDCSPLIVCRKASQPLDKVRAYWCQRNNLSAAVAANVFFTWNGAKLYNSTTGRSILQQIKRRHGTNPDGSDRSNGKIEVEAVTEEIYQYRQRQKERQTEAAHDHSNNASTAKAVHNDDQAEAQADQPPPRQTGIILKLVSQTVGTLNLRVRPDTTAVRIANAFHKKMHLDQARSCYLVFDGERLDDDATVEEVGFEEEDTVDVKVVEVSQSIE